MTKRKAFIRWFLFVLLSILGIIYTWRNFTKAFPVVDIQAEKDREEIIKIAQQVAELQEFSISDMQTAVHFRLDQDIQYYTELEVGGKETFKKMLQDSLYEPYTWHVRFFKENQEEEFLVYLTPSGTVFGFYERMPDDAPGLQYSENAARALVFSTATKYNLPIKAYHEIEKSSEIKVSGRKDYVFVFEHTTEKLGEEGRYRILFTVSGDKVTQIKQYVTIPESFYLRYKEMRAANRMISNIGLVLMIIFLGIGAFIGFFYLVKHHEVRWKPALLWGSGIALLQIAALFNQWPLLWTTYDTALSKGSFIAQHVFNGILSGAILAIVMTFTFIVAEGLTRLAFPKQIQLWKIWKRPVGATREVFQQTWIGYLSVGILLAFTTAFYLVVTQRWNWWSPASPLYDPNILAHFLPWLNPLAISLQAGFWEEALFRAIPIAGAALIGKRLGGKKVWIGIALVLQALIFGAGHASYVNQPAYARVVELFLPSLIFGLLYLRFGLLPPVILHSVYDVVWTSLPLFNTSAPGSEFHRVVIIFAALMPLWIVLFQRLRYGKSDLKPSYPNESEISLLPKKEKHINLPVKTSRITPMARGFLVIIGFIFVFLWYHKNSFYREDPGLWVGRAEARAASEAALADRGFYLSQQEWMVSEQVWEPKVAEGRFVRQCGGEAAVRQVMGTFLPGPSWEVRYVCIEGDVSDRAEEFRIFVDNNGWIRRFIHRLPEARPAPYLSEKEARSHAHAFLKANLGLDPQTLKEISATPKQMPHRIDWTFTWADTLRYPLHQGEGHLFVTLSGDEITDYNPGYIKIPEQWEREERYRQSQLMLFQNIALVILFILIIIAAIFHYQQMHSHFISYRFWISCGILLFFLSLLHLWNVWPSIKFNFNPIEPLFGQIFQAISFGLLGRAIFAFTLPLFLLSIRDPETDHLRDNPSGWVGLSAGFIGVGVLSAIKNSLDTFQPAWADYSALNTKFPLLDLLMNRLLIYVCVCLGILLIFRGVDRLTCGGVKHRMLEMVFFLFSGWGFMALFYHDTLINWLWIGFVAAIWLFWLYQVFYRAMPSVIPLALVAFFLAESIIQYQYNGYPSAKIFEGVTFFGSLVVSSLFCYFLKIDRKKYEKS